MPSKEEHLLKAERNQKFAETLTATQYLDWAVTVLFYAALHYVDAVLAVSGIDPNDHTERQDAIVRNITLKRIYPEYRTLEVLSRNARYFSLRIEPEDWKRAKDAFDVLRAHIRGRMGIQD